MKAKFLHHNNHDSKTMPYPCTTIHVRRGDSGIPRAPYRRYAAVQEYLDAAKPGLHKGDNIFLLTDDQSTIDEVQQYHAKDYHWMYMDRPRHKGIEGGFDGHIPSKDEAFDLLVILMEMQLAKTCNKLVYGQSGFARALTEEMDMEGRKYKKIKIDTTVSKEIAEKGGRKEEREKVLFHNIDELYKNKTSKAGAIKANTEPNTNTNIRDTEPAEEQLSSKGINVTDSNNNGVPLSSSSSSLSGNAATSKAEIVSGLSCANFTGRNQECCASWDVDLDEWWLHKPTWEISLMNDTTQCFSPIQNIEKRNFFREVYNLQWRNANCSEVITSTQVNSGYSAATNFLGYVFLKGRQVRP